jgi:hypothetical protein
MNYTILLTAAMASLFLCGTCFQPCNAQQVLPIINSGTPGTTPNVNITTPNLQATGGGNSGSVVLSPVIGTTISSPVINIGTPGPMPNLNITTLGAGAGAGAGGSGSINSGSITILNPTSTAGVGSLLSGLGGGGGGANVTISNPLGALTTGAGGGSGGGTNVTFVNQSSGTLDVSAGGSVLIGDQRFSGNVTTITRLNVGGGSGQGIVSPPVPVSAGNYSQTVSPASAPVPDQNAVFSQTFNADRGFFSTILPSELLRRSIRPNHRKVLPAAGSISLSRLLQQPRATLDVGP